MSPRAPGHGGTRAHPPQRPRPLRAAPDARACCAQGGVSGAVAKTLTAPIERVKLLIQTQDANPRVRLARRLAACGASGGAMRGSRR